MPNPSFLQPTTVWLPPMENKNWLQLEVQYSSYSRCVKEPHRKQYELVWLVEKKKKSSLISLCQRPESGLLRNLRAVLIRYKPENADPTHHRPTHDGQTSHYNPDSLKLKRVYHMESMRKRQLGPGCAKWFSSVVTAKLVSPALVSRADISVS